MSDSSETQRNEPTIVEQFGLMSGTNTRVKDPGQSDVWNRGTVNLASSSLTTKEPITEIDPDLGIRPAQNIEAMLEEVQLRVDTKAKLLKTSNDPRIILRVDHCLKLISTLSKLKQNLSSPTGALYADQFRKAVRLINVDGLTGSVEEGFVGVINALHVGFLGRNWTTYSQVSIDASIETVKEMAQNRQLEGNWANKLIQKMRSDGLGTASFFSSIPSESEEDEDETE